MPIFRRDSSASDESEPTVSSTGPPPAETARRVTYVAPGSKLVGLITGKAEVLVEGDLEGEVKLDSRVVIGPQGRVKGNIMARSVRIAGKLFGNVHGLERVELTSTASLEGNLASPRVVIADGAFFKGEVEMAGKRQDVSREVESARQPAARSSEAGAKRTSDEARDSEGS